MVLPAWQIAQAKTHTQHICCHIKEPDEESTQQELVPVAMSWHDETRQQASANECLGGTAQSVHLAEGFTSSEQLVATTFPLPAYVSAVMLTHI